MQETKRIDPATLAADVKAFAKLDSVIHSRVRLSVMSVLAEHEAGLTFTELRDGLKLTDGNLAAHLRALEAARMVKMRKVGNPSKPNTSVSLSAAGKAEFAKYLEGLQHILKKHR